MRTHIDWLTFTMSMVYVDETTEAYANAIKYGFFEMFGEDLTGEAFGGNWEKNERSRAPYTDAWTIKNRSVTLFASPSLTHCCVEISGEGCETLLRENILDKVLQSAHSRVTRIDIASDIKTDISPTEFVSVVSHERMRSSGFQKSETGETCYVGSQKSERYARVYRYAFPHPRHELLRVEHVFRRDHAKSVAKACLANSVDGVAQAAGKAFGWSHKAWDLREEISPDISITAPEKGGGKTISWLVRSVAPAFQRLVKDGTIKDAQQFFDAYFNPETATDA